MAYSSWDTIKKIIRGYTTSETVSMDGLKRRTGLPIYSIRTNSKYLNEIGILTDGPTRRLTEQGQQLGRALKIDARDTSKNLLQKVVQDNEFLKDIVSLVGNNGQMSRNGLVNQILLDSKYSTINNAKAGANGIIDLLIDANLLIDNKGTISSVKHRANILETSKLSPDETHPNPEKLEKSDSKLTIDDNVTPTSMEADANTELVSLKINLDIHISNIDDLDKVPAKLSPILNLLNQHQGNIKLSNSKKKSVDKQNTKRKSRQLKRGKSEVKREADSIETLF